MRNAGGHIRLSEPATQLLVGDRRGRRRRWDRLTDLSGYFGSDGLLHFRRRAYRDTQGEHGGSRGDRCDRRQFHGKTPPQSQPGENRQQGKSAGGPEPRPSGQRQKQGKQVDEGDSKRGSPPRSGRATVPRIDRGQAKSCRQSEHQQGAQEDRVA